MEIFKIVPKTTREILGVSVKTARKHLAGFCSANFARRGRWNGGNEAEDGLPTQKTSVIFVQEGSLKLPLIDKAFKMHTIEADFSYCISKKNAEKQTTPTSAH